MLWNASYNNDLYSMAIA